MCYSPLAREGRGKTRAPGAFEDRDDDGFSAAASNPSDAASDPKAELFTTACAHVFHRCCLVRCREADFSTCPMCRAALPPGLTPEHVREGARRADARGRRNARQNAIVGAAARAREAVRAQYVRSVVNGTRSGIPGIRRGSQGPAVGRISEEAETEGVETNASGGMPPWMSPPRSRTTGGGGGGRSASGGGGSAPATPARVPAAREGFVTAAEDLRRRAGGGACGLRRVRRRVGAEHARARTRRRRAPRRASARRDAPRSRGHRRERRRGRDGGAGNAATLAGVALADADFFRNAAAALLREESTSTRGGRSRDDDGEDGEDGDEDAVAIALGAEGVRVRRGVRSVSDGGGGARATGGGVFLRGGASRGERDGIGARDARDGARGRGARSAGAERGVRRGGGGGGGGGRRRREEGAAVGEEARGVRGVKKGRASARRTRRENTRVPTSTHEQ